MSHGRRARMWIFVERTRRTSRESIERDRKGGSSLWQVLPFQFARIASLCPTLIWTRTPQALDFRLVSA
jgi:hypothetical protein